MIDSMPLSATPLWALAPSHAAEARLVATKPVPLKKVDGRHFGVLPLFGTLDKDTLVWARENLYAMAADDSIGAILLHIDSPGGSVAGTADTATAVAQAAAKKPVVAFIEDIGASAAYWIASQASTVIVNRTGLAGSIGVFLVVADSSRFWEKLGVDWFVVKSGRIKGGPVEGAKLSAEVLEHLQERVDSLARVFIGDVARGRQMTVDRVSALADGGVFMGTAAVAAGLADKVSTYKEVLADMRRQTLHLARGADAIAAFDELVRVEAAERGWDSPTWQSVVRDRYPQLAAAVDEHETAEGANRYYKPGRKPGSVGEFS
jgi:signal peptide peptidase SppA